MQVEPVPAVAEPVIQPQANPNVIEYQKSLDEIQQMRLDVEAGTLDSRQIMQRISDSGREGWFGITGTGGKSLPRNPQRLLGRMEELVNKGIERELRGSVSAIEPSMVPPVQPSAVDLLANPENMQGLSRFSEDEIRTGIRSRNELETSIAAGKREVESARTARRGAAAVAQRNAGRLRDQLREADVRIATASATAVRVYAATANQLLGQCSQRYTELAAKADGHALDARTCRGSWPVVTK
jgi:hypothetical protein